MVADAGQRSAECNESSSGFFMGVEVGGREVWRRSMALSEEAEDTAITASLASRGLEGFECPKLAGDLESPAGAMSG